MIPEDGNFAFQVLSFKFRASEVFSDLGEVALLALDVALKLLVVVLLSLELVLVVLEVCRLVIEVVLCASVVLRGLVDELVPLSGVFERLLPLEVKLVALRVEALELLSCLVKLNLGGLSLCDLFFELVGLSCYLNCKLLNLKSELLDLSLISTSVFLKSEVILLLLAGCKGPLFKLLLIPVHLKLKLVHFLICLENHILDVV